MTGTSHSKTGPRRRTRHLVAFAALCAALISLAAVALAGATGAHILGKTRHTPPPSCHGSHNAGSCRVVGRVTGFPLVADGVKRPFNVHVNGKIVAWAVDLGRPTKNQTKTLNMLFASGSGNQKAAARLSVIKHVAHRNYRLVRQSPAVVLRGVFGRKEILTLNHPLKVRKGQIVALTYPTWAPNFAYQGLSTTANKWRSSRTKPNCEPHGTSDRALRQFVKSSRPQQKVGSKRSYECDYAGGRLLYWAYFVKS